MTDARLASSSLGESACGGVIGAVVGGEFGEEAGREWAAWAHYISVEGGPLSGWGLPGLVSCLPYYRAKIFIPL